ncbi:hypothetical protein ACFLTW_00595 [Chloroflexota bacterium]
MSDRQSWRIPPASPDNAQRGHYLKWLAAGISVGAENRYGHPNEEELTRPAGYATRGV